MEDTSASKKGFFSYPDEPAGTCPIEHSGACVDFWVKKEPLCVEKNGYSCTQFYQDALNGEGGVNNDVSCDTQRPFLCNNLPDPGITYFAPKIYPQKDNIMSGFVRFCEWLIQWFYAYTHKFDDSIL